jgi:hypothetical protein
MSCCSSALLVSFPLILVSFPLMVTFVASIFFLIVLYCKAYEFAGFFFYVGYFLCTKNPALSKLNKVRAREETTFAILFNFTSFEVKHPSVGRFL